MASFTAEPPTGALGASLGKINGCADADSASALAKEIIDILGKRLNDRGGVNSLYQVCRSSLQLCRNS